MGILNDMPWRFAEPDGFSYNLNIPSDEPVSLFFRFMGRIQNETWDCKIKADTTTIIHLKRAMDDSYPVIPYEYIFKLPYDLTVGKNSIRVGFDVKNTKQMPRLMEIRILRKQNYLMYPAMTI